MLTVHFMHAFIDFLLFDHFPLKHTAVVPSRTDHPFRIRIPPDIGHMTRVPTFHGKGTALFNARPPKHFQFPRIVRRDQGLLLFRFVVHRRAPVQIRRVDVRPVRTFRPDPLHRPPQRTGPRVPIHVAHGRGVPLLPYALRFRFGVGCPGRR